MSALRRIRKGRKGLTTQRADGAHRILCEVSGWWGVSLPHLEPEPRALLEELIIRRAVEDGWSCTASGWQRLVVKPRWLC